MTKKTRNTLSDEQIRIEILRFLFGAHRKAATVTGSRFKITELKRELKKAGLSSAEVARNLDYLVQNEWVMKDAKPITLMRSGTPISSEQVTYRISSRGIDLFQGESQFQAPGSLYGINIVQNAPGVIQVGSFNYVNSRFRALYDELDSLARSVLLTDRLAADEKWRVFTDVKTLQAQLMKEEPDKSVLRRLWSTIETLGKIGAFTALVERIWHLVAPLVGG